MILEKKTCHPSLQPLQKHTSARERTRKLSLQILKKKKIETAHRKEKYCMQHHYIQITLDSHLSGVLSVPGPRFLEIVNLLKVKQLHQLRSAPPGVRVHTCNPIHWGGQAEGSQQLRPCLKKGVGGRSIAQWKSTPRVNSPVISKIKPETKVILGQNKLFQTCQDILLYIYHKQLCKSGLVPIIDEHVSIIKRKRPQADVRSILV